MERLPYDVLAKIITSLSFRDVVSLCDSDSYIENFCVATSRHHQIMWRNIIEKTFGAVSNYQNVLQLLSRMYCQVGDIQQNGMCYNYLVYVNFILQLDAGNKAYIYYSRQDYENLDQLIQDVGPQNLLIDVAEHGHLDVVKYIVETGTITAGIETGTIIPGNDEASWRAQKNGHLDVFKYLREHEHEWL